MQDSADVPPRDRNPPPKGEDPMGPRRSWPRRFLNRLEVDRATFYAIATRYWKFIGGPITALLIASFFTVNVQSLFYLFSTIIAIQTYFELAFPGALIVASSRQWSDLHLTESGDVAGDIGAHSRLADITQTSTRVFLGLAVAFGISAMVIGWALVGQKPAAASLDWKAPLTTLIGLSSVTFALVPLLAILEGCDQVRSVYKMQLGRDMVGNVVVWVGIIGGADLWVPPLAMGARLLWELAYLFVWKRRFTALLFHPISERSPWKSELLPFQSRLYLKGLFSLLRSDIMPLVIFQFAGMATHARFAMTWTILTPIRNACASWVRTRVPKMGVLIRRNDFAELDRVFFRVSRMGLLMMVAFSITACVGVAILFHVDFFLAERLLPAFPMALLALGLLVALLKEFQWIYLHAHQRSPYLMGSIAGSLLSGSAISYAAMRFGVLGVCVAFAITQAAILLPASTWAFVRLRQRWHAPSPAE